MSAAPAIEVAGLSKQYRLGSAGKGRYMTLRDTLAGLVKRSQKPAEDRSFWALRDVSFSVQPGEVLGIIGRNGAGKSTLLKILSRITDPTAGQAVLRGRVGSLLEVGTGFHPELTGRENMQLSAAILGMSRAEVIRKFDEIVSFAGVEKFIDTPVKHYSSGMYLRLAFAVAAHLEPEILLVDEVLAVGDADFQKKCLGKMSEVGRSGRTIFFVSHNMAAIERLCTRVLWMHEGKLTADGHPGELIRKYLGAGLLQGAERSWPSPEMAPGDDVARLKSVRVVDATSTVRASFTVREPITIELQYWVRQAGHALNASFYFYGENGEVVFVSGDWQAPGNSGHAPKPVGLHTARCTIPGDLLNEGTLTVLASVGTLPLTARFIERDVVAFRVVDPMEPGGARGSYSRSWPGGAVRPLLDWKLDHQP